MLSWLARVGLFAEALAYAVIGASLHRGGWSAAAIVFAALAAALAFRLVFVLSSLALGRLLAGAAPEEARLPFGAWCAFVAREFFSVLRSNFVRVPWSRWVTPPDSPLEPATSVPIVLVHGYFANRGFFASMARRLRSRGLGPLFTPDFPVVFSTIERFAEALHERIETIAGGTGQARVVLVCHSMGGLAARRYLATRGAARVVRLVTIATPHAGTALAALGLGPNASQMCIGCDFLAALAKAEAGLPRVPTTSIYSMNDNLVTPPSTSRLEGARNVALRGIGHITILDAAETWRALEEELAAAPET